MRGEDAPDVARKWGAVQAKVSSLKILLYFGFSRVLGCIFRADFGPRSKPESNPSGTHFCGNDMRLSWTWAATALARDAMTAREIARPDPCRSISVTRTRRTRSCAFPSGTPRP